MTLILPMIGGGRRAVGGGGISPPITTGLVLHYDFNNTDSYPGSGTTVTDLSSTGADGTLTNGPVFNSGSPSYLDFDGDNDNINVGSVAALNCSVNNQITIAFAINWDGFGDQFQRIIDKSSAGFGANGWAISTGATTGDDLYFYTAGTAAKMFTTGFTNSTLASGGWYIMVVAYDGTTTASSYWRINNTDYRAGPITAATIPASTQNCRIGTANWTTGRELDGQLGFISVWNTLLSGTDATTIWDTYKAQYGLS